MSRRRAPSRDPLRLFMGKDASVNYMDEYALQFFNTTPRISLAIFITEYLLLDVEGMAVIYMYFASVTLYIIIEIYNFHVSSITPNKLYIKIFTYSFITNYNGYWLLTCLSFKKFPILPSKNSISVRKNFAATITDPWRGGRLHVRVTTYLSIYLFAWKTSMLGRDVRETLLPRFFLLSSPCCANSSAAHCETSYGTAITMGLFLRASSLPSLSLPLSLLEIQALWTLDTRINNRFKPLRN